jgi:acylphosphatase
MRMQRRSVTFTGDVQGVGFRYTACLVARSFEVAGYVRNCPDGTVEAVVEGQADQVDAFLAALADHMGGYIRHVTQQAGEATGEFDQFGVRF